MKIYTVLQTSLDDLLLIANPRELIGLYFLDSAHAPPLQSDWVLNPQEDVLRETSEQLEAYLNGSRTNFSLPLHLDGTGFQQRVWREIAKIPYGQTITYSELAERVGASQAIRAAGTATGRNPINIIVPCHRVVGKNGLFGGYAGGLHRKRKLLDLEMKSEHLELWKAPVRNPPGLGVQ